MNEYRLTFTVTFKEQDDPAARKQAEKIVESMSGVCEGAETKLQQVYPDKAPRKVALE